VQQFNTRPSYASFATTGLMQSTARSIRLDDKRYLTETKHNFAIQLFFAKRGFTISLISKKKKKKKN